MTEYCQCGKVARIKGLCFACNSKKWRTNHPEKSKENRKKSWAKEKEKNMLGIALRAFFKVSGYRKLEDRTHSQIQSHGLHLKIEFTCAKCHEYKKGFRTHMDGMPYCKKCINQIRDRKEADEIMKTFHAQEHIDKIDPLGEMHVTCTKLGTCDILHFHHELLKDDPERMRTDFLVELVCGTEKAEKYKKKKNA